MTGELPGYGKPERLYDADDLLRGYDPSDRLAFVKTWDFRTYRRYVADGAATPPTLEIRLEQAEHDARIAQALKAFLDRDPKPKLVGVMGGHDLSRIDAAYTAVAQLGRHLTRLGYLLVTGGGPGAMEAAHVGATFSGADDAAFARALSALGSVPSLPQQLGAILTAAGDLAPGYEEKADGARSWLNAALEVRDSAPKERGESLAIPTWFYGSEPSTPFASAYAKYFQNSIREEALITQSRAGIVYAQGGGGTLREIFQDVEQNYYATTQADFTPMIFFDPGGFWQHDAEFDKGGVTRPGIDVQDLLKRVFRYHRTDTALTLKKVRFTTNFEEIDAVLRAHAPIAQRSLAAALNKPF
jgi:predicted Rossmann-fold nucleotide-binding protein